MVISLLLLSLFPWLVIDSGVREKLSQSSEKAGDGRGSHGAVQAGNPGLSLMRGPRAGAVRPRPEPRRVSSAALHSHPQLEMGNEVAL